jgi:hypothetical protein
MINKSCIGTIARLAVLLSLLGVAALYAKDFWDQKKFTQWNEPECLALLSESPWARTQKVPGSYTTATPRVMDGTQGKTAGSGGSLVGTQGLGGSDSVPFYVRWYSSVRIRQALGRLGQLRSKVSDEQINQVVGAPMPDCLIAIIGPSMGVFDEATFESLKAKTFLLSKKDKSKKIELKAYASPKERPDRVALFTFPRELDGKPTIELADDEIEFVTEIGKLKIRVPFKLSKMTVDGNLDL